MKFYTYIYKNPLKNNEPFYVGKGKENRAFDHIKESLIIKNKTHKHYTILDILKNGLDPTIDIIYCNSEDEAYELEEFLIEEIGSNYINHIKNGPLCNFIPGGKGGISNMVNVIDEEGNKFFVSLNDSRYLSGELEPLSKGRFRGKFLDGTLVTTTIDDPRIKTGEIVSINKGMVVVKDNMGNIFQTTKDDPRYLSGELVGHTKGVKASKETKEKMSKIKKGRKQTKEHVKNKGISLSEYYKNNPKKYICLYCNKIMISGANAKRYHFDNCKWNWKNAEEIDKKIFQEPIW